MAKGKVHHFMAQGPVVPPSLALSSPAGNFGTWVSICGGSWKDGLKFLSFLSIFRLKIGGICEICFLKAHFAFGAK